MANCLRDGKCIITYCDEVKTRWHLRKEAERRRLPVSTIIQLATRAYLNYPGSATEAEIIEADARAHPGIGRPRGT